MTDIRDILAMAAGDEIPPDPATVAADLARGRAALARRRRRAVASSVVGVGAVVVAATVLPGLWVGGHDIRPAPVAVSPARPPAPVRPDPAGDRLVPYPGTTPVGLHPTVVPRGWTVAEGDESSVLLSGPSDEAVITATLVAQVPVELTDTTPVLTPGGAAVWVNPSSDGTEVVVDHGAWLVSVFFPATGGVPPWTVEEMVRLAGGIELSRPAPNPPR